MGFLTKLVNAKNFIIGLALALLIGLAAGIYVSNAINKAKLFTASQQSKKLSKASVAESNAVEVRVATTKQAVEVRYKTITKEIIKYVPETIIKECKTETGDTVATTLNTHAVRLLNDTASDANFQSADVSQVQTATEVGLRELSEHIVVIKKQYEDLAIEHDGLLDYNDFYKNLIK